MAAGVYESGGVDECMGCGVFDFDHSLWLTSGLSSEWAHSPGGKVRRDRAGWGLSSRSHTTLLLTKAIKMSFTVKKTSGLNRLSALIYKKFTIAG